MFFLPIGRTYSGEGAIELKGSLPSPIGGEPFPSRGKFKLISYDQTKSRALVRWTQIVDSDAAARVLLKTMRTLSEKINEPIPDLEKVKSMAKSMSFEDRCEFTIDVHKGWVKEFTHTRTSPHAQGATLEFIMVIRRVVPPPSP